MTSFTISARKYRPQTFSQIQGQQHITTTLKNALKNNQLAQVFLFHGPKGTGKTTCARILAKAINCTSLSPTSDPCQKCTNCSSINQNNSINIHELDAASHNSVQDTRALLESVRYHPPTGKKILIIDEAHMLSNAAFHGFLKILEEPPSHVIFIFATTEKHKVIDTILSRCQIFDFHHLTTSQITTQLQHIAHQENLTYEPQALQLISHKAQGSLRDALSTFDLIVNFEANKTITYQATLRHLNLLDHTYYFTLIDHLVQKNTAQALLHYDKIMRTSFRGDHFITGLSEHLRNLLTTSLTNTLPLINPAITQPETYKQQAQKLTPTFLHHALNLTHHYSLHYKNAHNKRLHIELLLLNIIQQAPSTTDHNPQKKPTTHTPPHQLPKARQTTTALSKQQTTTPHPLTKAHILNHWQAYAKTIESNDPSGFSIMNQPITLSKNTILISLVSPLQEDKLNTLKPKLLTYLKKELNNNNLTLRATLQPLQQPPKPKTQQDHLNHLINKNKHINTLQHKLNLELI